VSEVTHEYPRAYKAATEVDPLVLAQALDHIARTAARSRSQTRRTRWIEQRALIALSGEDYRDIDVDLPKNPGPGTPEKLHRRMTYHIAIKHQLAHALMLVLPMAKGYAAANSVGANAEKIAMAEAALNSVESEGAAR